MRNLPTFSELAIREASSTRSATATIGIPDRYSFGSIPAASRSTVPAGFHRDHPREYPGPPAAAQSPDRGDVLPLRHRRARGQGADRIIESCIHNGQALPDYRRSDAYQVSLTLNGELRRPELPRLLSRIEPTLAESLDVHDHLVLRAAALGEAIPVDLQDRAAQLQEAGLIERTRGGKYMPARAYSEGTGAFQDERPRDLAAKKLLAFLHEHAADGKPMEGCWP